MSLIIPKRKFERGKAIVGSNFEPSTEISSMDQTTQSGLQSELTDVISMMDSACEEAKLPYKEKYNELNTSNNFIYITF
jgi:hypothetical protein